MFMSTISKKFALAFLMSLSFLFATAQAIRIPQNNNYPSSAGRSVGVTEIEVKWNSPGVKGREGKIWGTNIAWYGFTVLGFGSNMPSPWRAGADECTTISFSTDVTINGKKLAAGKYALFMDLQEDSTTLIFNKNINEWGSYFYDEKLDVLRVSTKQIKNMPVSQERLNFAFYDQKESSVSLGLDWEYWRIPMMIEVDLKSTILAHVKSQMSGELGFDPPSLQAAANWCEQNNVNLDEALNWINSATSPNLGGLTNFNTLSTKSKILAKLARADEAKKIMDQAMEVATAVELHQYGRRLLNEKKVDEALMIFDKNYKKNNGAWPTAVGMMRGLSAKGDYKKALEYAKTALTQATDDINKKSIEAAIKSLEAGKAL
jgi:tetratricopeptide (TPR) repeat protein